MQKKAKKKENKSTTKTFLKEVATVLPSGFGFRDLESSFVVLDFLDQDRVGESPHMKIIGSYLLPEKMAKSIRDSLTEMLEQMEANK